jgi:hypothetical protein
MSDEELDSRHHIYAMSETTGSPEMITSYGFMKIGERRHMETLLRRGQLYCQPLANFQKLEEDPSIRRADSDEGLRHFYGPDVTSFTAIVRDKEFKFSPGTGPLRLWDDHSHGVHIYSLSMVEKYDNGRLGVRTELLNFGDTFVWIHRPGEFLRRVEAHRPPGGRRLEHGAVEYVSRLGHAGEMGPFRKFDEFAGQLEYRLAIYLAPVPPTPITYEIGSLEDIAIIGDCSSFRPGE